MVGMATFGDGGLLASKPYVSSAAYLNRMSDRLRGCRHDIRRTARRLPVQLDYLSFLDDIRQR